MVSSFSWCGTSAAVFSLAVPAWADHETSEQLTVHLVSPAFNTAYYHSHPEDTVTVEFRCSGGVDPVVPLTLGLVLRDADGRELDARATSCTAAQLPQRLSLRKPAMNDGATVHAVASVSGPDSDLVRQQFLITQQPSAAEEVVLSGDGITLVNGEPFFPLGIYQCPLEEIGAAVAMGFNTLHSYEPVSEPYLRAAAAAGARVITAVRGVGTKAKTLYYEPEGDEPTMARYIQQIREEPGLLGYYIYDEPSPQHTPPQKLAALCDIPRRYDPYHLVVGCNNVHQRVYHHIADAMMVDNYPVPHRPWNELIERVSEGLASQSPEKAMWFIPQAFPWEPYFPVRGTDAVGDPVINIGGRPPTFDEVRSMAWLGLVYGAPGLIYYSWQIQGFYIRDAYPVFWRGFEHHIREIKVLESWLVAPRAQNPPVCDREQIHAAAWQRDQDLLLAVVNASPEPVTATLTCPGLNGRPCRVICEGQTITPVGDRIEVSLGGYQTRLFTTASGTAATDALPMLQQIRDEQQRLQNQFDAANASACTFDQGGRVRASWGFPTAPRGSYASWLRMIDGNPGTPWIVGGGFRTELIPGWDDRDFASAGRWIEVCLPHPQPINTLRAVMSTGVPFQMSIHTAGRWQPVQAQTVVDTPSRHHRIATATTTASFPTVTADRFRVTFTSPKTVEEAVFELAATYQPPTP